MNFTDPNRPKDNDGPAEVADALSEEQKALARMLGRFLAQRWQQERRRAPRETSPPEELS